MPASTSAAAAPAAPSKKYELIGPRDDLLNVKGDHTAVVERIQSLLAQWLRMENVAVLIGAGASKGQNGPLIPDLEQFVLKAMKQFCSEDGKKPFAPVIDARIKAIGDKKTSLSFEQWLSHLTNVAHILNAPETPVTGLSLSGIDKINPKLILECLSLIGQIIFVRCSLKLPSVKSTGTGVTGHHALVAKFVARDPSLGRTSIFTTNYDTLLEQALDDLSIQYADGFAGTVRRRFDPAGYGLDVYYPGEVTAGRVRRFDKYLHLYKLHGSIHWWRDGSDILQSPDPRLGNWEAWEKLGLDDKKKELERHFVGRNTSLGILPTECKFTETLGMPYAHLFRAFHQRLQEPQTFLVVLGYSFGDDHINRIIDDAMTNPSLVLLVVDPFPSKALRSKITQYGDAGERVFLLTGENPAGTPPEVATFDDFAKHLLPNVQWLSDFLALRKTEQALRSANEVVGVPSGHP